MTSFYLIDRTGTLLFVLIFICFSARLSGQSVDWLNPDNTWTYSGITFRGTDAPHRLTVDRDTLIDGLSASIIEQQEGNNYASYDFEGFHTIILRQEGDTLYQYIDTAFRILYDFSLDLGDTTRRYVPRVLRNRDEDDAFITYRVDSVATLAVGARDLKGYHLTEIDLPQDVDGSLIGGWNYELLGNPRSYLLPYGYFYCDGGCPRFLRCFSSGGDGGNSFFYRTVDFPCDSLINSTREPDIGPLLAVGPNPVRAGGTVRVGLDASIGGTAMQVTLYDAAGRRVSFGVTEIGGELGVAVPALAPAGVYTLVIRGALGRAVRRVVVVPGG